jgi:hypothetical protein
MALNDKGPHDEMSFRGHHLALKFIRLCADEVSWCMSLLWALFWFCPLGADVTHKCGHTHTCGHTYTQPHTKEQFVLGVLRELSVSLCKTNACLVHGVSGFFVRASIRHGRSRPTVEVSVWD